MPYDVYGSTLENEISEIDREIKTLEQIIERLRREKRHKESVLLQHRQRDKENGVKY